MPAPSLNEARFVSLLAELVALGPKLQNAPAAGLVPCEALAADVVLRALEPHIERGAVRAERIASPAHPDRPSLWLTLPGAGPGSVAFVGAHLDVVPADREAQGWHRDPFALTAEDGVLYGRGTTDCLGHVALLTELLASLAEERRVPARSVEVLLISNEESSPVRGLGLEYVAEIGRLEALRGGPIYWLDSADFGPTVGTGGVARWRLDVTGVPGHSGMPQNCVNALELAMAASLALGRRAAELAPPHPEEQRYGFLSSSSLKATLIDVPNRGVTTIPGTARVEGDLRLTPFHDMRAVQSELSDFARALGSAIARGEAPPGFPRVQTQDGRAAIVRFAWNGEPTEGLACDLDSPALAALEDAIGAVRGPGAVRRFSITGALPLVRDLQRRGFDLQITGFGESASYHAANEQAKLADFRDGFAILRRLTD